jgi:hypothetical protein
MHEDLYMYAESGTLPHIILLTCALWEIKEVSRVNHVIDIIP